MIYYKRKGGKRMIRGLFKQRKRVQRKQSEGHFLWQMMGIFLLGTILIGCGKKENPPEEILVGAAASLQNVMEELQGIYKEENPDAAVTFSFASSGSLEQQIREGAPIDVFFSAASKQMDALAEDDLITEDTRVDLLENQIVLIVPLNSNLAVSGFEDILGASMIALGNPESVPVGQYSQEIFEYLGIWDEVYAKSTLGKDVTEVLAWVSSGNVDAGVVYATDAKSSSEVEVAAIAPEGSHNKVIYPAAVIKGSKKEKAAKDFIRFLGTDKAEEVFVKYGFIVIK
jgi:molybdate transport system substrate-binding protein